MPRDEAVLLDLERAARYALAFVEGFSRYEFLADVKTQSAIIHQLLILGEATKRLSDDFKALHPEIPWRYISGMRDHLVHGYDTIDLEEVWNVLEHDLPDLLSQIKLLLPKPPS